MGHFVMRYGLDVGRQSYAIAGLLSRACSVNTRMGNPSGTLRERRRGSDFIMVDIFDVREEVLVTASTLVIPSIDIEAMGSGTIGV